MSDENDNVIGHMEIDPIPKLAEGGILEGPPTMLVATGWCAPSEVYTTQGAHPRFDIPEVTARRGGIQFSRGLLDVHLAPRSPEEIQADRDQREAARAERKAAGGEWHYAAREPDGTIWDHNGGTWDIGNPYFSEGDLRADVDSYLNEYEVLRRWVTDPPEWEPVPTDAATE